MSLFKGSISFAEFEVVGELPEGDHVDFITSKTKAYAFKDIDDSFDEFSVGWVSPVDMFDSRFVTFPGIVGDFVVLSLRIDERKVGGKVLKKFVDKEIRRTLEEKQIPRLGRAMRIEIKERVMVELLRKAKPEPQVIDMFWSLPDNRIFFLSCNARAQFIFEVFFKDTFGLMVKRCIPYTIAESFLDTHLRETIAGITPSSFI